MIWPTFFPENCPPKEAKPTVGVFYRVITDSKQRSLKEKDFYSHKKKQPNRTWSPDMCACALCGVSITQTIEDSIKVAQMLLMIPAYQNKICFIAEGDLNSGMGSMKHTPDLTNDLPSHHDWWLPDNIDPSPHFRFREERFQNSSTAENGV